MFGRIALFAVFFLVSASAFAQNTLPAVQVTGMRINEVDLCGNLSCNGFFNAPIIVYPIGTVIELEDVADEPTTPACHPDGSVREGAVWAAYQFDLRRRHGDSAIGRIQQQAEDRQNWGETMTILFADGSFGLYERTDSTLGSSHGFIEMQAPACARPRP
jgi:hypothetical protein